MEPIKLGILGSTKGSDLPAIVKSINSGKLEGLAEIAVTISDRADAEILEKARNYGFENVFIDPRNETGKRKKREPFDKEVDYRLKQYEADLLVNIGWGRLYSAWMVEEWRNKNMNIHPSLLPSFPGMDLDVHKAVLDYGCTVSGCTLFFIDEGMDTGPIILQRAVQVLQNDTPESLKERVQASEQEVLVQGIKLYAEGRLSVDGRKVNIY